MGIMHIHDLRKLTSSSAQAYPLVKDLAPKKDFQIIASTTAQDFDEETAATHVLLSAMATILKFSADPVVGPIQVAN